MINENIKCLIKIVFDSNENFISSYDIKIPKFRPSLLKDHNITSVTQVTNFHIYRIEDRLRYVGTVLI